MTYPTAPIQTWFDPDSFFILNPDATLGPAWHDGDTVQPGQVLDLDQWAIFDTPNQEYAVVFIFDGPRHGLHWNTKHLIWIYDPASPPPASLQPNGKPKMFVPVNVAVKVSGGYQDAPDPRPGTAGQLTTCTFTAEIHSQTVPITTATTAVSFSVLSPERTDRAEGYRIPGVKQYGWRWKNASGLVIAHNDPYPDRPSMKQAALAVAG